MRGVRSLNRLPSLAAAAACCVWIGCGADVGDEVAPESGADRADPDDVAEGDGNPLDLTPDLTPPAEAGAMGPCAEHQDCPGGHLCYLGVCRLACDSADQCQEDALDCIAGVCTEPIVTTCSPDESHCEANTLVRCTGDGERLERVHCGRQLCEETVEGVARCALVSCDPGPLRCTGPTTGVACVEDGDGVLEFECLDGESCEDGVCRAN